MTYLIDNILIWIIVTICDTEWEHEEMQLSHAKASNTNFHETREFNRLGWLIDVLNFHASIDQGDLGGIDEMASPEYDGQQFEQYTYGYGFKYPDSIR